MDEYACLLEGGIGSAVSGSINTVLSGEIKTDVAGDMKITAAPMDMNVKATGDVNNPIGSRLTGDPKNPIASTVDLLNMPHLTLRDIKDILTPKIRVHIPNYQQISFKVFGVEVCSWCLSGESQVITQPFVPNRFEQCNIECPDEDKRPFPETPVHKQDVRIVDVDKKI
jgi:hypothetical protein